ncbi:hypothetical protein ACFV4Q_27185, partial [Streptomyces nojiriensis]|uniref:hypothetical protein n=1 Tax=Streptomyces nojiriensis TaxID=66374 RepID=UPI003666E850
LLLDEPTNHLSPALAEELEEALARFAGAGVGVRPARRVGGRCGGGRAFRRSWPRTADDLTEI